MNFMIRTMCALSVLVVQPAAAQYSAVNSALSLNGSSYMSVTNHDDFGSTLSQGGRMSIDAWVYPTSISGIASIVGHGYTDGYWLGLDAKGNVLFKPNPGEQYLSNAVIPTNTWTHVGASYDVYSQAAKIYINGVLDKSTSFLQGYIYGGGGDLRIGADRSVTGGPAYFWNGYIDELRIWSAAIDFTAASGLLYRVPHGVVNGRWGKHLAAGWRLNGITTEITNQHTGSLVGNATFVTAPDPAHYENIGAVMFNTPGAAAPGTQDYFSVPHSASISLIQNFTLECWVKPSAQYGDTQYQTFIEKGSKYTSSYTYWLGLKKSNNRVYFVPHGNFGSGLESNMALPMGQWSHVAARYSTSGTTHTATIFVNGEVRGSQSFTSIATANTHPMYIGRSDGPNAPSVAYGYSGVIDEVRVWNVSRSDDQVADNYLLRYNGPQTGLAAVYRLDGDVLDFSGNGNNGDHVLDALSDVYFESTMTMPPLPTVSVLSPNGGESLPIGQVYKIRWQSTGLKNVALYLSRNNGGSFTQIVPSVAASAGEYEWTVTGPETPQALVRITTPSLTGIADTSNAVFTIVASPRLEITPSALVFVAPQNGPLPASETIKAENIGGGNIAWNATWSTSGWLNISPVQQAGNTTMVSASILTTTLPEGLYTDTIRFTGTMDNSPVLVPVEYTVTSKRLLNVSGVITNAPGTTNPVTMAGITVYASGAITKSVATDEHGAFAITDLPEGNYVVLPEDTYLTFLPAQRSYNPLNANVTNADFSGTGKQGTVKLQYSKGWNLISIPLEMTETALAALIPDAEPPAYSYDQMNGYVAEQNLVFGPGYWVKCSRDGSVDMTGILKRSVEHSLKSVNGGWNLVGVPSAVCDTARMVQTPPMSILAMYDFTNTAGYLPPFIGFLWPGRAYWVKTRADGTLVLLPTSVGGSIRAHEMGRTPGASIVPRSGIEP